MAEVVFEAALEVEDGGGRRGLISERAVEEGGDGGAVGVGQEGEPLLLERVALVAGETVEAFEIHDVGAGAGGERAESGAQEGGDGDAALLVDGVAGDEGGEGGGGDEGFVAAAEVGVAGDDRGFLHEPGAALVGRFEEEGGFVEEVEGDGGGGEFFRDALQNQERALVGGKGGEGLERVGGRAFREDEDVGLERGGGHGARGGARDRGAGGLSAGRPVPGFRRGGSATGGRRRRRR